MVECVASRPSHAIARRANKTATIDNVMRTYVYSDTRVRASLRISGLAPHCATNERNNSPTVHPQAVTQESVTLPE